MNVSLALPQKLTLRPSGVRFCRSSYKAMSWSILLVVIALRDAIGLADRHGSGDVVTDTIHPLISKYLQRNRSNFAPILYMCLFPLHGSWP